MLKFINFNHCPLCNSTLSQRFTNNNNYTNFICYSCYQYTASISTENLLKPFVSIGLIINSIEYFQNSNSYNLIIPWKYSHPTTWTRNKSYPSFSLSFDHCFSLQDCLDSLNKYLIFK